MEFTTFFKIRRFYFGFLFLFFSLQTFSQQITSFSEDLDLFQKELKVYLDESQNDNLKKISKQIEKIFKKKQISKDDLKSIRDICNLMIESKMRPSPYFENLLDVVLIFTSNELHKDKLSSWTTVCEQIILKSSSKQLLKYCTFSKSFLSSKKIRDTKSVHWSVDAKDFFFVYESSSPLIRFGENINLTCSNKNGSFIIEQTEGEYQIFNNIWQGNGGVVNWERVELSRDSIYAYLSDYTIDIRKSEFSADSVRFYNRSLFEDYIIGSFVDKIIAGTSGSYYPVFKSYKKDIILSNILPDVDYMGGYTLRGNDFIADGRKDASARMIIRRNNKEILVANAERFSIKDNIIYSVSSAIRIYFDEDSIYHPSLQFTYDHDKRKLILYRDNKAISGSPIYNSYHNVTIDAELLEWNIDDDYIYIGSLPATSKSSVYFESIANYDDVLYQSLKGIDRDNPLILIKRFLEGTNTKEFTAREFARYTGYPEIQIQHYLINLANKGFLFYDISLHKAIVQTKLDNYVDARLKLKDYDVISFKSEVSNISNSNMIINSSINLSNKNLDIKGVETIMLSDSQLVYVYPSNGDMVLKENRDFNFSGKISVGRGRLVLFGQDFSFNYENFKINLEKIDSLQLAVPILPIQRDQYGNEKLVRMKTVIQAVSGDLRIDDPGNKSGLRKKDFPHFPIFRSFNDSYVYYDKPSIYEGVYNRKDFYFHLDTFEIDSLESYNGRGLRFPGFFESAGIFPGFYDTLKMMNDYSLGFRTLTPEGGYELYGGKARYNDYIFLSNDGLMGNGKMEYLTSISSSNEMYFFPDSTALFTQEFLLRPVEEGIEFPEVQNLETFALFQPYSDRLKIHILKDNFRCYNNQSFFNGDILLRPTGLTGNGIMILDNSEMTSNLFSFNANWFASDTADLTVFTEEKEVSFKSKNLNTHIDLIDKTGDFFSNGDDSYVVFPTIQYISYIDKLRWKMEDQMLLLGDQDENSLGSRFISIHQDQDSLSFVAKTSTFNLKDNIINVFDVAEISIADAIIYPNREGFFIEKDGFIPTITDATILVDTTFNFHEFTNVEINILGKNQYNAFGDYTYFDALGEQQEIFFRDIHLNDDNVTIAFADIEDDNFFKISSKFDFKGTIELDALRQFLTFNGYFKINSNCKLFNKEWISFRSEIDPKSIKFSIENVLVNEEAEELSLGTNMTVNPASIYTSFFTKKVTDIDVGMIKDFQYLFYDPISTSFIISGSDSLSNIFSINENTCVSESLGKLDLNMDLGQVKIESIGAINRDEKENNTEFHIFLLLDFLFSKEALNIMSENIYEAYGEIDFKFDNRYKRNLTRLVGFPDSDELLVDLDALDEFTKLPDELYNTLSFTDLRLVWSDKYESYLSEGPIGLGNIYDKQINTVMDGWIRLSKEDGEDDLSILLKTSFGDIYFFEYSNNQMYAYSTNEEFNQVLINTKSKKRRANEKKGKAPYRYLFSSEERMENFEREMVNLKR